MKLQKFSVYALTALGLVLLSGAASSLAPSFNSVQAAASAVDCIKGKNGIKGKGCGGTVTLQMGPGGVINATKGYGVQVATTSTATNSGAILAQAGPVTYSSPFAAIRAESASDVAMIGLSNDGSGVYGHSSTGSGAEGHSDSGAGVFGNSGSDRGVYGSSTTGVGVEGQSDTGFAMHAIGPATQSLTYGGWVKALARFGGGTISRCYNSQLSVPDVTAPCAFTLGGSGGNYTIDFGFKVSNRFVSVTPEWGGSSAVIPIISFPSDNVVRIQTYSGGTTLVDSAFMVVVY